MENHAQKTSFIEGYFDLQKHGTTIRTEVLAGATTFIAIAYILILNPQILADPYVIMGDTAMAGKIANGVFIGTCIGAFIGTILVGLYAKLPFAQAPGMGLNAFFAYTVVLAMGYTYGQALVIVFISGIFFIVITAVGLREAIIRAIPDCVKAAITPGIGLFITIIGLKNSGLPSTSRERMNTPMIRSKGIPCQRTKPKAPKGTAATQSQLTASMLILRLQSRYTPSAAAASAEKISCRRVMPK